jgi:cell division protein FtsL
MPKLKPKKTFELYNPKIIVKSDKPYRISPYTFITLFIIFMGILGIAFTYAFTDETRRQITQVHRERQEQNETNIALRTEMAQRYTLDEVAKLAGERMGMNTPDSSQVIYIEVPKQSYIVLNQNTEDEADEINYFWQGIVSFFKNLGRE